MDKRCLVIGAGVSGLVTAKELLDAGITDITILESSEELGGVWHQYCWKTTTLTSSKWITEFGSYPMPEEYPEFLIPEQMMEYLENFAVEFGLKERIQYGVTVKEIQKNSDGTYDVIATDQTYQNYEFVVLCTGLHGSPLLPNVPGLEDFEGKVVHGSTYKEPETFRDKRVLCIGLGESGVGINSEISSVAAKTIVSASSYNSAPRVIPNSNLPIDQLQCWPLGRYTKDYEEIVNGAISWYSRLPHRLREIFLNQNPSLSHFPQEWRPRGFAPRHWHAKFWPKGRGNDLSDFSGNYTLPEAPPDDILYLVRSGQIVPKGPVVKFDQTSAYFSDGSQAEIDLVVANTGYQPSTFSIQLPNDWQYQHQELYKGCFHPDMPNLAFVGMVRPTIGSIPAMAEMQARLVAGVFSGVLKLPEPQALKTLIIKETRTHAAKCPEMSARFPHVYFFEQWMEEMADLIGCRPTIWHCLGHSFTWQQLKAYWIGASMPLRFRLTGPGAIENGYESYAARVDKVWQPPRFLVVLGLVLYPNFLAILLALFLFLGMKLSVTLSFSLAFLCWILYMTSDLFRFAIWLPHLLLIRAVVIKLGILEFRKTRELTA